MFTYFIHYTTNLRDGNCIVERDHRIFTSEDILDLSNDLLEKLKEKSNLKFLEEKVIITNFIELHK